MTPTLVIDLGRDALLVALQVAGPLLATALITGLIVSVIQAVTQIQEQTLSFVPKMAAVGLAIAVLMPWMLRVLIQFMQRMLMILPQVVP